MIYIIVAIMVIAADIITKIMAENSLMPAGTIPIIKDIIHLTYVENRGIAFGMFSGGRIVFIIVSLVVLAVLGVVIYRTKEELRSKWMKAGITLVFGGAIGNLIERIYKGYVVDFIDFKAIDFPVFNIADIAVCTGAALLVIHFLFIEDRISKSTETEANDSE